jgi:hypothetical protein
MPKASPFKVLAHLLPKDDPRYLLWKESLKKRPLPWNKGVTKDMDERVKKISDTFKRKKLDNFSVWREEMKRQGKILSTYPPFEKSKELAILTGLILGDGNIHKFPRTEKLTITLGTDKPKLIEFAFGLVEKVISKKPKVLPLGTSNAIRMTLYQKNLSERFFIPSGKRRYSTTGIPGWIWESEEYILCCLRGLFEAEASLSVHLPTYTYNFAFANRNEKLLSDVSRALSLFGLHPEVRTYAIRLRRKDEVKYFKELISFRNYDFDIAGSANGRHHDSESCNLGSNPSPAA